MLRIVQFLAIVLTALSLAPAVAHLASLLNKIDLPAEQYLVVQSSYRGWHSFAFVLVPAIIVDFVLAFMLRGRGLPFWLALIGSLCMAATLTIFFTWVYPANVATDFWTTVPANWETLRRDWEYGHALNALITFIALCAVTLSALTTRK